MSELPAEMHDIDREALVDRIIEKFDALFFALCEQQRQHPDGHPDAHTGP